MRIFENGYRYLLIVGLTMFPLIAGGARQPSDWISAPKPKFPKEALKKGAEGWVKLQVVLDKAGHVVSSRVLRSSGDPVLDATAQTGVAKWRMNPAAVRPSDLTTGRATIIEFKQEAIVGARYPDRLGYFEGLKGTDKFMSAPFPSYPLEDRRLHHTGTALIAAATGADGRVVEVYLLESSGYPTLDRCALAAVRLWRVHKQYAGYKFKVPIAFAIGGTGQRAPPW
jgi:TonB family protein